MENKTAKGSIFVQVFSSQAEDDEDMSIPYNDNLIIVIKITIGGLWALEPSEVFSIKLWILC